MVPGIQRDLLGCGLDSLKFHNSCSHPIAPAGAGRRFAGRWRGSRRLRFGRSRQAEQAPNTITDHSIAPTTSPPFSPLFGFQNFHIGSVA